MAKQMKFNRKKMNQINLKNKVKTSIKNKIKSNHYKNNNQQLKLSNKIPNRMIGPKIVFGIEQIRLMSMSSRMPLRRDTKTRIQIEQSSLKKAAIKSFNRKRNVDKSITKANSQKAKLKQLNQNKNRINILHGSQSKSKKSQLASHSFRERKYCYDLPIIIFLITQNT